MDVCVRGLAKLINRRTLESAFGRRCISAVYRGGARRDEEMRSLFLWVLATPQERCLEIAQTLVGSGFWRLESPKIGFFGLEAVLKI